MKTSNLLREPVGTEAPSGAAPVTPASDNVFAEIASSSSRPSAANATPAEPKPTTTPASVSPSASPVAPSVAPASPAPGPVAPAAGAPPAAGTPGTVPGPVVPASPVQPTTPVAAPTQAAPVSPAAPSPISPEAQAQAMATARQKAFDEIKGRITFTPEQVMALNTAPETVLPELVARLQLDTYEAVVNTVLQALPQYFQTSFQAHESQRRAEESFFVANPDLRGKDMTVIARVAGNFMRMNPTIPAEQAYKEIGALARYALGITPATQAPTPVAPSPVTPVAPTPAQPYVNTTPLLQGTGTPPVAAVPGDIWAEMALRR